MSKARLVITAVVVEGRSKSEVARDYDVSRQWVHQLVRRYLVEGEAAFEPGSRRPHTSPQAVPAAVEEEIIRLRKELSRQGLDAGADTIRTPPGPFVCPSHENDNPIWPHCAAAESSDRRNTGGRNCQDLWIDVSCDLLITS